MPGPSFRDFLTNWRSSDLPLPAKVRAAIRNSAIKVRTKQNCCGNHGEPGC